MRNVAGSTGLAAASAEGKVIWTLDLPPAANRLIESDESGVSISSFDLAGVERAEGMKSFIMGNTGDEPKSEHQTLAYATAAGKLQASFNRPVFSDGNWYAAHLNHLVRSIPPARCRTTAAASASFPRS